MNDQQKAKQYLKRLANEVKVIILGLPPGVHGEVSIRGRDVYTEIAGPRGDVFTLVLGSEAPEIVYAGAYIRCELIGDTLDDQLKFIAESVSEISYLLLTGDPPVESKTKFRKKPYIVFKLKDGNEWRLRKFA